MLALQAGGRGFESRHVHQISKKLTEELLLVAARLIAGWKIDSLHCAHLEIHRNLRNGDLQRKLGGLRRSFWDI
jgi:hypothetical protein